MKRWMRRRESLGFGHPGAGFGLPNPAGTSRLCWIPRIRRVRRLLPSLWKPPLPGLFLGFQPKPAWNSAIPPLGCPKKKPQPELCFSITQPQIPAKSRFLGRLPLLGAARGGGGGRAELLPNFGVGRASFPNFGVGRALAIPEFPRADGFSPADGILWPLRPPHPSVPSPPLRALPIPPAEGSEGSRHREDPGGHVPNSRCSSPRLPRDPKSRVLGVFLGNLAWFYCPLTHPPPPCRIPEDPAAGVIPKNPLEALPALQTIPGKLRWGFPALFSTPHPVRKIPFVTPNGAGRDWDRSRGVLQPSGSITPRIPAFFFPSFVPGSTSPFVQKKKKKKPPG